MISLARLAPAETARVLHLKLAAGQDSFVGQIGDMVSEIADGIDFHIIEENGQVPGFFKTDLSYADHNGFAQPQEIGLRGFLIDASHQGCGVASRALAILPDYLRSLYPDVPSVVLTVSCDNPAAYHVYQRGGFSDTGELCLGGRAGPQHIMRLPLADPATALS